MRNRLFRLICYSLLCFSRPVASFTGCIHIEQRNPIH